MPIERTEHSTRSLRFSYVVDDEEAGHAFLAIIHNDLHDKPFGLLENVHVDGAYRGRNIGNELVNEVIDVACKEGCYKLLATCRLGGTHDHLHHWYERLGFVSYGVEFRMNF